MSELKPCPFCGGEANFWVDSQAKACNVTCKECRCGTIFYYIDECEKAIEVWNTRTIKFTPHKTTDLYALYKRDEFLAVGTAHELAEFMGIKLETFYWYTYPSAKKRMENRKRGGYWVEKVEE